jgi:hypothetical protein
MLRPWPLTWQKNVFQRAYADANWKVISTSRLSRSQFQRCFHNSSVSLASWKPAAVPPTGRGR